MGGRGIFVFDATRFAFFVPFIFILGSFLFVDNNFNYLL